MPRVYKNSPNTLHLARQCYGWLQQVLPAAANPNGNRWKTQQCLHQVRHHLVRPTANLYVHRKFKRVEHEHPLPVKAKLQEKRSIRVCMRKTVRCYIWSQEHLRGTWKRIPNECVMSMNVHEGIHSRKYVCGFSSNDCERWATTSTNTFFEFDNFAAKCV